MKKPYLLFVVVLVFSNLSFILLGNCTSLLNDMPLIKPTFAPNTAYLNATCNPFTLGVVLDGGYSDYGADIAVDSIGNIIAVGRSDSIDFPKSQNPSGNMRGVISKLDKFGNVLWSHGCGASIKTVSVDSQNNIYYGGIYLNNSGFLVKVNPEGSVVWNLTLAASVNSIFVSSSDIIGAVSGSNFYQISTTGVMLLNMSIGSNTELIDAVSDPQDNFYFVGKAMNCSPWAEFPKMHKGQPASILYSDVIIAKINSSKVLEWNYSFGGNLNDEPTRLFHDSGENSLIISGYTNSLNFPKFHDDSEYGWNANGFVVKIMLNPLDLIFSTLFGNDGIMIKGAVSRNGHTFIMGYGQNEHFPRRHSCSASATYGKSVFIAEFSKFGFLLTASDLAFPGNQYCENMYLDSRTGEFYMIGYSDSNGFPLTNTSSLRYPSTWAILIAKIQPYSFPYKIDGIQFPDQTITYHEEREIYWKSGASDACYFKYNVSRDQQVEFKNAGSYLQIFITNQDKITSPDIYDNKKVNVVKCFAGWTDGTIDDPKNLRNYTEITLNQPVSHKLKYLVDYETGHIVEVEVLNPEYNSSFPYLVYGLYFSSKIILYNQANYTTLQFGFNVNRVHQHLLFGVKNWAIGDNITWDLKDWSGDLDYSVEYDKTLFGRPIWVISYDYKSEEEMDFTHYSYGYDKESGLLLKYALTELDALYNLFDVEEINKQTMIKEITSRSYLFNGKTIYIIKVDIGMIVGLSVAGAAVVVVYWLYKKGKLFRR